MKLKEIQNTFRYKLATNDIEDNGTIEILNASFIANEETLFGEINLEYAKAEVAWYLSQSLSVNKLNEYYAVVPKIWKSIASKYGNINSNYGWCIYSKENGEQFLNTMITLARDKNSRQATMIYNRPSMHVDCCKDRMTDFMCTNTVQLMIRGNTLHYMVYMRSNDAVFGYKNDRHWHNYVFNDALKHLKDHYPHLAKGNLYWNAASLHVYPRHFKLVEESAKL